ncbi:complement C1q-like protein 4 [Ruditapes philippinarum]|uniref:complement C1q-like protein 4 n=1 Tax=Ruditapes philippinarum TaxID=129788 RepID=UPI00295BC466|nr:complement C1q-like protein 4 [Ruditapes philippinarum]
MKFQENNWDTSSQTQKDEKHANAKNVILASSGNSGDRIRRAENEVTVAFTAGLTKRALHVGAHQNIVFDHVETNVGNGYNPHHGVFTAPVPGLYVFYTSVLADNDREVWCELIVNGAIKASVYARGTDGRHDQGSQALVIQLKQGDDIAVQNVAADDAIYGDPTIYSTFTGFLLQQDFSEAGNVVG